MGFDLILLKCYARVLSWRGRVSAQNLKRDDTERIRIIVLTRVMVRRSRRGGKDRSSSVARSSFWLGLKRIAVDWASVFFFYFCAGRGARRPSFSFLLARSSAKSELWLARRFPNKLVELRFADVTIGSRIALFANAPSVDATHPGDQETIDS